MFIRKIMLVAALSAAVFASVSSATILHPGKWTNGMRMIRDAADTSKTITAVSMLLVPSPADSTAEHSRIIVWSDDHEGHDRSSPDDLINIGGRYLWSPPNDTTANSGTFPNANFQFRQLARPGYNIFCSSLTLLGTPGGELFVGGGTREAENGSDSSAIYHSASDTWQMLPNTMHTGRWYASSTTLPDGRVLMSSGSRYRHRWVFGSVADDSVRRGCVSHNFGWDPAVVPLPDTTVSGDQRPLARRAHSAAPGMPGGQTFFGGQKLSNGSLVGDCWVLERTALAYDTQSEYGYQWWRYDPFSSGVAPTPRMFHSAVVVDANLSARNASELIVVGGQTDQNDAQSASSEIWSATATVGGRLMRWKQLTLTTNSDAFPARYGHAAFWSYAFNRTYVFGGVGASGAPTDAEVYALEFPDSTHARWHHCVVQNPQDAPSARAFMAVDEMVHEHPASAMLLYGGRTGTAASSATNELWLLWPVSADTVRWKLVPQAGSQPPALAFASGTSTINSSEFWLLGGKNSSDTPQAGSWSFDARCGKKYTDVCTQYDSLSAVWEQRAAAPTAMWGHSGVDQEVELFARVPEVFNPADNSYRELSGAPLLQDWFPQAFVIPTLTSAPSTWRVFTPGPTRGWVYGDLLQLSGTASSPTASRAQFGDAVGFRSGSAVQYRPGKIMKCGTRDTEGLGDAIGSTNSINLNVSSPTWVASNDMIPRVSHNLVVLPDGKVMVLGGMGYSDNQVYRNPVKRPEIWDPDANSGAGQWEGAAVLDTSHYWRGYHSTAMLLPDGRIFCAGGNVTTVAGNENEPYWEHQLYGDLYSPPYLFGLNGTPALRPEIRWSPRRVSYGQKFVIGVNNSANIAGACLIRPATVTHGFDQSQRYVPLSIEMETVGADGNRYHRTTAPADSSVAPPGEYLLFVLNEGGTPAIARWVYLSATNSSTGQPTAVTDLTKECSDGTSVTLNWTPPGTDSGDPVLAPVAKYDIRYKTSSMTNETSFLAGNAVSSPPTPGDPTLSDPDRVTLTGLTLGQNYFFRLRAKNATSGSGNWSALSNQMSFVVHDEDCEGSGGGGGGEHEGDGNSARRADTGMYSFRRPGGPVNDSSFVENTLLPNVPLGTTKRDRVRLPYGPKWIEGAARVRLSRGGTRATHFDAVRLVAVDHAADEAVFVHSGEFACGVTDDPVRITHADGRDLTNELVGGEGFDGREGDTLYVEFGHEGPGSFVISSSKAHLVKAPDRTGLELASESAQEWISVGHHDPRQRSSDEVFDSPSLHRLRIAFLGVHHLEGVARFTAGSPGVVTTYTPTATAHSRLGDVTADLADTLGTSLAPGDHMLVDFAAAAASDSTEREWFLEVTGTHMAAGGGAMTNRAGAGLPPGSLPTTFALGRNRPNPFAGVTTIGFDIPRRAHVRLEIFDVLGRRVAMLADRDYEPGRFTLDWDGRTSAGTTARAGVYLCRMIAGSFRSEQHLVLVK